MRRALLCASSGSYQRKFCSKMTSAPNIIIRQLQKRDEDQCRTLFAKGMKEVWEAVYGNQGEEAKNGILPYIEGAYKDDLKNITAFYVKPKEGSNFWVAVEESNPDLVIGMVAIEHKSAEDGELRRMSVSSSIRRGGLGRRLISELEKFAKEFGYKRVILSTGGHMGIAQQFYAGLGYNLDKIIDYPLPMKLEPDFKVYFYSKVVNPSATL